MHSPIVERRVEFLANKEKYERDLEHETSVVLQFFDNHGAEILNYCSTETQHRIFEAQEAARFHKTAKLVKRLKKLCEEVQDEIKNSSLQGN